MSDFEKFIQQDLNKAQRAAVEKTTGPLLVIAGAGSGKTRVITARIAYLLQKEQIHPAQIVALTFTNKAANEMKERIAHFLGKHAGMPFVGTFHSYCLYLLKTNVHLLPFSEFSILDEDDKRSMITKLLKHSPLYKKHTAQQLSYSISLIKNQLAHPNQSIEDAVQNQALFELYCGYEKEKKASNCFDFDDLLLEAVKLFDNQQFQRDHQNKVRHVLIDEYQDTNVIQHTLLKKMALEDSQLAIDSVCAVGDEDQSIYSWRGATVDNIVHFQKDFKGTQHIKIEQNYRSKQPILTVANHVISNNKNRNEKKLWSERDGNDCVRMIRCLSGYQEADIIARYCKILQNHKRLHATAILYRTHFQSRTLEEALIKHSIPYQLIGGIRFYERKEIRDIIAYLRLIINPFDRIAFERAINCPPRGLGEKFIEQFFELWDAQPFLDVKGVFKKIIDDAIITGSKLESLTQFFKLFVDTSATSSATETIAKILTTIGYLDYLKKSCEPEEAQSRQENIKELLNAAHFFANQGKGTISALLDEVSLLQEKGAEDDAEQDAVLLMTLHAAKGLEFDNVIITGLEENLFPSSRSLNDTNQLEEERRLFYVGITRARNRLVLTTARYRQTYGQMEQVGPSRFLKEVPSNLCKADDASSWQQYEVTSYFSQWLGYATANPEVMVFQSFKAPETVITNDNQKSEGISFKKHQTIKHTTFGIGVVQHIEYKQSKTFVTAQFKIGIKKLDAKFIKTF